MKRTNRLRLNLLTDFRLRVYNATPESGESIDVERLIRDFQEKYRTSHEANIRKAIAALVNRGFLHRSMAGYVRRTGEGA